MKNTRTLNNNTHTGKKPSKKTSKKNRNTELSTTEEMRQILDSDTENVKTANNLIPYQGEVSQPMQPMGQPMMQQPMMQQPMMQQPMMGQMNNAHLQMYSPSNYDPLMLQQMAPVQTTQALQSSGMGNNLLTPNAMLSNLSNLGRGPSIGAFNGAPTPAMSMSTMQTMQTMPTMPASGLSNLQMLGGAKKKISKIQKGGADDDVPQISELQVKVMHNNGNDYDYHFRFINSRFHSKQQAFEYVRGRIGHIDNINLYVIDYNGHLSQVVARHQDVAAPVIGMPIPLRRNNGLINVELP
jgi:hypothetical protein